MQHLSKHKICQLCDLQFAQKFNLTSMTISDPMLRKILPKIYKTSKLLLKKINLRKFAEPMDRFYFDHFLSNAERVQKGSVDVVPDQARILEREIHANEPTGLRGTKGEYITPGHISGLDRLNHPGLNKSLAFSIEERQLLGIHGLLPPVVKTQEQQIQHCKICLDRLKDPINKYIYITDLMDCNEKLCYAFVRKYVQEIMPLLYTPTVGTACQKWGLLYRRPRGIYITIYDKDHIYAILKNYPEADVRVIVVTDGERILGLGDQGACGMGIPVGKLSLYTALAGIKPHYCLPVTLDVGTNSEIHLKDPLYPGLREKRHTGQNYDDLIEEFMHAVVRRWGRKCLIQFEDFGNKNAFRFLQKYRDKFCTFNDDIQGTASVVVAGIIAGLRITKNKMSDHIMLFYGAGEANIGIANLCVMAMTSDGKMTEEQARKKIWLIDSKGLIVKSRKTIEAQKAPYAQDYKEMKDLTEMVKTIKPTILIGAAAIGGVFTSEILKEMAKNSQRPMVFALSNPTPKAECTPEQAYKETKGSVIYASGSPFPPVQYNGKTYITGQANNAYIFPAVGLAGMCCGIPYYTEDYFLIAAEALACLAKESDLAQGCIYSPISTLLECSTKIATRLVDYAYKKGTATVLPEPQDKECFVRSQMYDTDYESAIPCFYDIPAEKSKKC